MFVIRKGSFPAALVAVLFSLFLPLPAKAPGHSISSASNPTRFGKADVLPESPALRPKSLSPASMVPPHSLMIPPWTAPSKAVRSSAVLKLIHYPWQDLGFDVFFLAPRSGFRAMTISDSRRIEIYLRPGDGPLDAAYDLAHELGHAFDLQFNDDSRRSLWCSLRGIDPKTPWFGCNRCPDFSTPAGDFAETFAYLLLGPGDFHSRLAPPPKVEEIPRLASFCRIDLTGLWCAAKKEAAVNER